MDPILQMGIALGEINRTINDLEVVKDVIEGRINSLRRRSEDIKDEMRLLKHYA